MMTRWVVLLWYLLCPTQPFSTLCLCFGLALTPDIPRKACYLLSNRLCKLLFRAFSLISPSPQNPRRRRVKTQSSHGTSVRTRPRCEEGWAADAKSQQGLMIILISTVIWLFFCLSNRRRRAHHIPRLCAGSLHDLDTWPPLFVLFQVEGWQQTQANEGQGYFRCWWSTRKHCEIPSPRNISRVSVDDATAVSVT
ncbi:unnamed protein product [Ectocarpus sp. 8 AP-2014]